MWIDLCSGRFLRRPEFCGSLIYIEPISMLTIAASFGQRLDPERFILDVSFELNGDLFVYMAWRLSR